MKSQFFFFLVACVPVLVWPACEEPLALESGTWQLTAIVTNPEPMQIPANLQKHITIGFSGGKVKGHGGCNGYGGEYTASDSQLAVSGLISTKMYCQETSNYETAFFQSLQSARSYQIEGKTLEIICGDMGSLVFQIKAE